MQSKTLNVVCGSCDNEWIIAYFPDKIAEKVRISLRDLGFILDHARCPRCESDSSQIHVAPEVFNVSSRD